MTTPACFQGASLSVQRPQRCLFGWIIKRAIDVDCHPAPFVHSISNKPLSINGLSPKFERRCRGEMWETNLLVSHPLSSDDRRHQSVVINRSAKFSGNSHNYHLYRGVDYLNTLPSVLIHFRQHFFTIILDIETTFHTVKMCQQNQTALRFLWKRPGSLGQFDQIMPFAPVCSPSVGFYLIRKTLAEHEEDFFGISDVVISRFYADNYLASSTSSEVDLI